MALPSVVVFSLKDTSPVRYLSITGPDCLLRYDPKEGVFSPTAKFAVEPVGNGLVHLRSCYHNHYWARELETEPWLSASAKNPVEDSSNESCTLFKTYMNSGNWVRFQHVRSGLNVVVRPAEEAFPYYLAVENSAPSEFKYIDYESLVKIPRYVMFKGDNDKYLSHNTHSQGYLHFLDIQVPTHRGVGFETSVTQDGDIRLKHMLLDKFLRFSRTYYEWIWADYPADSNPAKQDTLFQVVPSKPTSTIPSGGGIALRCRGNYLFCKRLTDSTGITSCLAAATDSPDESHACLLPIDAGKPNKRRVTIKAFRQGRVYNRASEKVWSQVFDNQTNITNQSQATISYTVTNKQTFSCSISQPSGIEANFTGQIPVISHHYGLQIPNEVTSDVRSGWGQTRDLSEHHTVGYSINVPPFTKVTSSYWIETATCEVPFSYEQSDEFFFGGTATQLLHDGVFRGVYTIGMEILKS
ncbi:uncharacterized protein LOC141611616 [Silene latifolia]|uniref:uncharacterized protein LOC141611616 n=1 Tax=Silene latifolia TaxID=37657 RepID=UPI003D76DD4C